MGFIMKSYLVSFLVSSIIFSIGAYFVFKNVPKAIGAGIAGGFISASAVKIFGVK